MLLHELSKQNLCTDELERELFFKLSEQSIPTTEQQRYFSDNEFVYEVFLKKPLNGLATVYVQILEALSFR